MQDRQWPVKIELIWEEWWKSWRWNCHFWLNKKVMLKRKGVSWKPRYENGKKDSLHPRTSKNKKMFSSHLMLFFQLNLTFFSMFWRGYLVSASQPFEGTWSHGQITWEMFPYGLLKIRLPTYFKDTYPSTRCIIDCTEIFFVQVPSSLITQSALYSHYKHHVTYRAIVGISPFGAITFVSRLILYPGSLSDKEIVSGCGIHPQLWKKGDSIMTDRGLTIPRNYLTHLELS